MSSQRNFCRTRAVYPGAVHVVGNPSDNEIVITFYSEQLGAAVQVAESATERDLVPTEVALGRIIESEQGQSEDIESDNEQALPLPAPFPVFESAIQIDGDSPDLAPRERRPSQTSQGRKTICGVSRACCIVIAALSLFLAILVPMAVNWRERPDVYQAFTAMSSEAPSQAPSVDRFEPLSGIINGLSPGVSIDGTVQHKALAWLALEDPAQLSPDSDPVILIERYTLAFLFFATNGRKWVKNTPYAYMAYNEKWLSEESVCEWQGIECEHGMHVTTIRLFTFLNGVIPTEIALLKSLTYLHLVGNNNLAGTVPTEIGMLTRLREIQLADNCLTGKIPTEFGMLTNLECLFLDRNKLTGTIPTELAGLNGLNARFSDNNLS